MWWNPHGEMMCSAEGWQSRGGELTMSEACWTTYMFRTAAPVCQHRGSTNPLCSHYRPDFSSFASRSVVILAAADVCPCIVSMSHITYLIFFCCLLEHESLTTMGWLGQWFECCKGREDLILTSPSPQISSNTWRISGCSGLVFGWTLNFGLELKVRGYFLLNNTWPPLVLWVKGVFRWFSTAHV